MLKDRKVFLSVLGLNLQPWGCESKGITTQPLCPPTHTHTHTHPPTHPAYAQPLNKYTHSHSITHTYSHTHSLSLSPSSLTYQHLEDLVPKHLLVAVEDVKETVERVLQELDQLLPTDVLHVGEHHTQVLLTLTPLEQHQQLDCVGVIMSGRVWS